MKLSHLSPTATADEVVGAIRDDGAVIVDRLASKELMDRIFVDVSPYIERTVVEDGTVTTVGTASILGRRTLRTGSLIARSPAARELVMHPLALGVAKRTLHHDHAPWGPTVQLHLTQVISILPGERAQRLHRDQDAWDRFPFPTDYEVLCNTLWAMSDYTGEMGATRVIPGSHRLVDISRVDESQSVAAEMDRGSVLFYSGRVVHGGGANRTDQVRQAVNVGYSLGWIRQEENQFLTTPFDVARGLDDDLLRLMGYQTNGPAIGYARNFEDPLLVLRDHPSTTLLPPVDP